MKKIIATVAVASILAGCASSVKPDTVTSSTGSSIDIYSIPALVELNNNRIADNKLRQVTPTTNAVGKGLAILSVMTGNFNSSDFDKENYKGTTIDTMTNPTDGYFTPKAKKSISEWLSENTNGYKYQQPLNIGRATWALIFKDATATDPIYQLKYKVIFYKYPEDKSMISAYTVAECAPTAAEAPLAEWSKDGYAKVTLETQKYMDSCLLELNNQLPRLLKK